MDNMPSSVVFYSVKPPLLYFIALSSLVGVSFGLYNNFHAGAIVPAFSSAAILLAIAVALFFYWRKILPLGWTLVIFLFAIVGNFMVGVIGYWNTPPIGQLYFVFAFAMSLGMLAFGCFILPWSAILVLSLAVTVFFAITSFLNGHPFVRTILFSVVSMIWGLFIISSISRRNLVNTLADLDFHRRKTEDTLKALQESQKQVLVHEKVMSMGLVTSGVAHELKNPLNLIHNFTDSSLELVEELVQEWGSASAKAQDLLKELKINLRDILYQSERSNFIVHSMILRSKTGSAPLEVVDMNGFVEESATVAWFSVRTNHPGAALEWAVEKTEGPLMVPIRRGDLAQAYLNLMKNAFQAASLGSEPGRVDLKVGIEGSFCVVSIQDNGAGVPPELLDKVFLPFFTTKGAHGGLGLGLPAAYDIVTNCHQGRLTLEGRSDGQKGTLVKVFLPLAKGEEP